LASIRPTQGDPFHAEFETAFGGLEGVFNSIITPPSDKEQS
jgi:hypothetical protein